MGTEAIWVPLALAAAGAGTSYVNQRNTNRRLDNEALTRTLNQQSQQRKADQEISNLLTNLAASNPEKEVAKSLEEYTTQLQRNKHLQTSGAQDLAGASDSYRDLLTENKADVGQYGDKLAGLFARIDGAMRQREREGIMANDTNSRIGMISRASQGQDHLSNMRMESIRPNPLLTAFSELAYGAASGYTGGKKGKGFKV